MGSTDGYTSFNVIIEENGCISIDIFCTGSRTIWITYFEEGGGGGGVSGTTGDTNPVK